jgi:hypothetical protein
MTQYLTNTNDSRTITDAEQASFNSEVNQLKAKAEQGKIQLWINESELSKFDALVDDNDVDDGDDDNKSNNDNNDNGNGNSNSVNSSSTTKSKHFQETILSVIDGNTDDFEICYTMRPLTFEIDVHEFRYKRGGEEVQFASFNFPARVHAQLGYTRSITLNKGDPKRRTRSIAFGKARQLQFHLSLMMMDEKKSDTDDKNNISDDDCCVAKLCLEWMPISVSCVDISWDFVCPTLKYSKCEQCFTFFNDNDNYDDDVNDGRDSKNSTHSILIFPRSKLFNYVASQSSAKHLDILITVRLVAVHAVEEDT